MDGFNLQKFLNISLEIIFKKSTDHPSGCFLKLIAVFKSCVQGHSLAFPAKSTCADDAHCHPLNCSIHCFVFDSRHFLIGLKRASLLCVIRGG